MPSLNTVRYVSGYGIPNILASVDTTVIVDSVINSADGYVVKYDTDGVPKWAARITSSSLDGANGVFAHTDGSVYAIGFYRLAPAGIFNADGTAFTTLSYSGGVNDVFLVKYNSNGAVQWATRIGGASTDTGRGVAVDSSGNVYITGDFAGTMTVFSADTTAFGTLTSGGSTDSFVVKYNSSGAAQWRARIGGTGADLGNAIATDSTGAVYVAGQSGFAITVYNADGTAAGAELTNLGGTDAYLAKYNAVGVVQWRTRIGSTLADNGLALAVDSSNNVYVAGSYAGTLSLYHANDGTAFSPNLTGIGGGDAFVGKYNSAGRVQWNAKIANNSTSSSDSALSLVTDSAGNVYVGGSCSASSSFTARAYNANTTTIAASAVGADGWIVKYNSSGIVQYMNRITTGGAPAAPVYGLDVDSNDNLYAAGGTGLSPVSFSFYNSTTTGDDLVTTINSINTRLDSFLVKYNSSGAVQWVRRIASSDDDSAFGVSVDAAGNSYTCGQFIGSRFAIYGQATSLFSTVANVGNQDTFAIKYNTNGAPQWAARIASTAADLGWSTVVDSTGNLYVGGTYAADLTLTNANGTTFTTLTLSTATDSFIAKYTSAGVGIWAIRITGNSSEWPYGMALDSGGNLYICGEYRSATTSFLNSDGTTGLTLNGTLNNSDAYLVKYSPEGFAQWVVRCTSASGAESAISVTIDSSNNIYLSGTHNQTMSVISSNGVTFGTTLATAGGNDAFLIKLDSSGIVQWLTRVGSTGADAGFDTATDSSGNVYIVGAYNATPTIYNSNGTTFGTLTLVGQYDAFIVKYNASGFAQWATRMSSTSTTTNDYAYSCKVDSLGNIYVGGGGGGTINLYNSNGSLFGVTASYGFLIKYNTAGFVQWVCNQITTVQGSGVFSIAIDSNNNIYTGMAAGGSGLRLQLTNSDGSTFATTSGAYSALAKYNASGFGQWVQNIGNLAAPVGNTKPVQVSVSSSGDVYITGRGASGSAIQIYNIDTTIYKYLNTLATQSAFIVKQSSTAVPRWAVSIGISSSTLLDVQTQVDSSGNVYVTGNVYFIGSTLGTATFYNADGTTAQTLTAKSFIAKYNTNGVFQWCAGITSSGTSALYGMCIDSGGSVFITGTYTGASGASFYNSDGTLGGNGYVPFATANYTYVAKYSTTGVFQWTTSQYATTITSSSVAVDSFGNIYVTGRYVATGAANFSLTFTNAGQSSGNGDGGFTNTTAGSFDGFVAEYDTDGRYQWCAEIGGAGTIVSAVTVTGSGDIHVTGTHTVGITIFNGSFAPGGQTTFGSLVNSGNGDVFIVKYNTSGAAQWSARVASAGADSGVGITVDSASNVYVTGLFTGTGTAYNANASAFATTIVNMLSSDMFLVKYNSAGTVQWITQGGSADVNAVDRGNAVTTDSTGAVYVAGYVTASSSAFTVWGVSGGTLVQFASTASAPNIANTTEPFLVKYDSAGAVQWISKFGGSGSSSITSIALDSASNIYTTGYFNGGGLVAPTS